MARASTALHMTPRAHSGTATRIRQAARRLLFMHGPRELTMDAVAQAARVSKATLYALYPKRHALLAAVVAEEAARIDLPLDSAPSTRAQLRADLERFVLSLQSFLAGDRHARLMQAMGQAAPAARDLTAVYRHGPLRAHERLADYLRCAAQRGLVACADPAHAAELLLGMAMGLDLVRALYRQRSPYRGRQARAQHARHVVDAFLTQCCPGGAVPETA